jgi:HAD superfamily phosphoserine phosphatase-like hydrolase
MKIKIALLDFDGTLVTKDILDLLCKITGKEKESENLNEEFRQGKLLGLTALIRRINFLKGVKKTQISKILKSENYLMTGCKKLMDFFKKNQIVTILASGNIIPVLEYYQQILSIDYIVGSKPQMNGDTILGIDESAFSSKTFKLDGIQIILKKLNIKSENIIALGNSLCDKEMFELSSYSIAINPKDDIANSTDAVINEDLNEAIVLLEKLISTH